MTPGMVALKILDGIFVASTTGLILWLGSLPIDWLSDLVGMALGGFH